jgi:hypothetical protein
MDGLDWVVKTTARQSARTGTFRTEMQDKVFQPESPCLLSESLKLAIRLNYNKKTQCARPRAMGKLNPSNAIGDCDRTHPLIDGKVQIAGIDPTFMFLEPE